MRNIVAAILISILTVGCATSTTKSIRAHQDVRSQISIGQTKTEVLSLLSQAQSVLPARLSKEAEVFEHEGKTREVHFVRSNFFGDGLVTDDEFTPYIFDDDLLVAIGWTAIGGPKTQGQNTYQARNSLYYNRGFFLHPSYSLGLRYKRFGFRTRRACCFRRGFGH